MNTRKPPTKAFQLTEDEIWAADSLDEAVDDYVATMGEQPDLELVCELSEDDLDRPIPEYDEDELQTGNMTSLRNYLAKMVGPGLLASTRW